VAPFGALEQCADVLVVVSTMVSMIIMIMLSTQPLPARGADDHHRPVIVGGRRRGHGAVTFRIARCAGLRCQRDHLRRRRPPSAAALFVARASNLVDLRLLTLWRQTMRLAQIIIFLVGALAAVGLLIVESMAP
jgi:hypothetical protein